MIGVFSFNSSFRGTKVEKQRFKGFSVEMHCSASFIRFLDLTGFKNLLGLATLKSLSFCYFEPMKC